MAQHAGCSNTGCLVVSFSWRSDRKQRAAVVLEPFPPPLARALVEALLELGLTQVTDA